MYEGVTSELARSTLSVEFEQLPDDAIHRIKLSLIDCIGCILAGSTTDRGRIALEMMRELGGNPNATVFGVQRTSYTQAAFVNSELLNALDYDYIGPISGHIAPFVVSPCLALAEHSPTSGKELILALALANEIGGRCVSAFSQHKIAKDSPPWFEEHPRFTYATSIFGGVAGAARLMRFNVEQLENAFGIAGASTAVPATMKWQHMSGPAIMTKYNAWSGWISQLAASAALAAHKGFTGDRSILDGEYGYWNIVGSSGFRVEKLLDGLGSSWHIDDIRFKLFPTCYIYHAGIQGINELMRNHSLLPDEITEIVVYGDEMMQTPNRMGIEVNTFADAQFFIRFNYALAVFHGERPDADWQMPEVYQDERVRKMVSKVRIAQHPDFEDYVRDAIGSGTVPILWSSKVEIRTTRGMFTTEIASPRGSKQSPVAESELLDKFWANAGYSALPDAQLQTFVASVLELERVDNVGQLFAPLVASR